MSIFCKGTSLQKTLLLLQSCVRFKVAATFSIEFWTNVYYFHFDSGTED